jgi:hypothetical protein
MSVQCNFQYYFSYSETCISDHLYKAINLCYVTLLLISHHSAFYIN